MAERRRRAANQRPTARTPDFQLRITDHPANQAGHRVARPLKKRPRGRQIARATKRWCPFLIGHRSPSASAPPSTKPRDRECGGPNSMKAAGFFSLATSKCPPGSRTVPSPRDPFGTIAQFCHALRPQDQSTQPSMSSTRGGVSWSSKTRPRPSAHTASIWGSCLGSIEPERFAMFLVCQSILPPSRAAGETRRSSPLGRPPRSETSDRFGRDANKCQRPREVARRPRGALEAGSCSTYRFPHG